MTEQERLAEWSKLINRYNDLIGSKLPEETGKAWYAELKRFDFLIVSLAVEEVCKHNKQRGWPPFGAVLEKCEANAAEARRAEEEQRKREELRRAAETRGGDGFGFVEQAEAGDFSDKETMRFAKAIYTLSKTQAGRDWLAKERGPDGYAQLNDWQEPRPKPLCIILAKCMRNSINCVTGQSKSSWTAAHEYVNRVIAKAELPEVAAGGAQNVG